METDTLQTEKLCQSIECTTTSTYIHVQQHQTIPQNYLKHYQHARINRCKTWKTSPCL